MVGVNVATGEGDDWSVLTDGDEIFGYALFEDDGVENTEAPGSCELIGELGAIQGTAVADATGGRIRCDTVAVADDGRAA